MPRGRRGTGLSHGPSNLRNLRYDGIARRPAFLVQAGDSDANSGADPKRDSSTEPPNGRRRSGAVTIPGYNHIDVVGAAWHQLGGRAERSSRSLVRFACGVTGDC